VESWKRITREDERVEWEPCSLCVREMGLNNSMRMMTSIWAPPERICGSDRPCVFHRRAPFKPPSQSIPCPTSGGIRPYRNLLQRTFIAGRERSNATGEQRHLLVRVEMNRVTSTRVETFSALLAIAFPSSGVRLFTSPFVFPLWRATCIYSAGIL
jgi:hypothetical protein